MNFWNAVHFVGTTKTAQFRNNSRQAHCHLQNQKLGNQEKNTVVGMIVTDVTALNVALT